MTNYRNISALAASLVCVTCQPTTPANAIMGENVIYQHSYGLEPCGGTIQYVDDFVGFLRDTYELELDERIRYRWLSRSAMRTESPDHTFGVAIRDTARSILPAHLHEASHAALYVPFGYSHPVLNEGFATLHEALDLGYPSRYAPGAYKHDPADFIGDDDFPYNGAQAFVAYLLSEYGSERFFALYDELNATSSRRAFERTFEEVYGTPLDDELESYRAVMSELETARLEGIDRCSDYAPSFPIDRFPCHAPRLEPWDEKTWYYFRDLSCTDEDVVGGFNPEDPFTPLIHERTVEITTAGEYLVEYVKDPDFGGMRLGACNGCPWTLDLVLADEISSVVWLDPGIYFVHFWSPGDGEFKFHLRRD